MGQPEREEQPAQDHRPGRARYYLAGTLVIGLPMTVLLWAGVEKVRDAADRSQ